MTGQELDRVEESQLDILPPKQPPAQHAMTVLVEASQAMDIAWRYASSVCRTQVCPARFRGKPEDGAAAILYGLEVGLSPAQSLQRVVIIHGMPSLEARTMVGLLQARGYRISTLEQSDEQVTVEGTSPDGARAVSQWTIQRATQAGYVPTINPQTGRYHTNANGKLIGNEKYITDPQAMLKAKAQAEVCRDLAPEILMGIQYATEDLQSEQWDGTISVQRPRPEAVTVDEILSDATPSEPEQPEQPEPEPEPAQAAAAPEPVESRVATERLSEEEPAEAPPQPAEPDAGPKVAPHSGVPVEPGTPAREHTEGDNDEADEMPNGLNETKVKQMFALLREGGIQVREDRLVVFRKLAERADITSTKDLTTRDLNKIVAKLKGYSDAKTIVDDLAEIIWDAAQTEATAAAENNTEEN